MLTADGCLARRRRLMKRVAPESAWAIVADPRHLMYLANLPVEPISWSSPPPGLLLVARDGTATLVVDNLAVRRPESLCVERLEIANWYNGVDSPGDRRLAVIEHLVRCLPRKLPDSIAIEMRAVPAELLRRLSRDLSVRMFHSIDDELLAMRAVKDSDELDLLRRCIRAGEAGHARAWDIVRPGVTELDVYREVASACVAAAGQPAVVYGDFCSGPRTWLERGGPPTDRILQAGDLMILDFSVVIAGYRSDFTNTIAVGNRPTSEQCRLFDLCRESLVAAERTVRPGTRGSDLWQAVHASLTAAGPDYHYSGHAGHGIGLAHPEPPIFVPNSSDTLAAGNVITLEPGVYIEGVGGMRFEHNYVVTKNGFERLTNHRMGLAAG